MVVGDRSGVGQKLDRGVGGVEACLENRLEAVEGGWRWLEVRVWGKGGWIEA